MKKEFKPNPSSMAYQGSGGASTMSKGYNLPLSNTLDTPSRNTSYSSKLNSYLTPENDKYGLISSSPSRDQSYASIVPLTGSSKVDLSEELASQIEYNNALLKELQTMERKVQDLNKELSLKDQELRNSSQEKYNLSNKIDKLQGEIYNAQFIVDRLEHENGTIKDQLETSKRKNQDLQNEIKESLDKLDISTQQLSDRNSHTKDLEHELNMMKDKCEKCEEEITNLHFQMDDYTNQLVNEKNQYIDLQKQYDQERDDFMNDTQRLAEDIEKLKRELSMSDKERDRILFEKDLSEKKIYDLETQLEGQTIQNNEKMRKSNEEYDHLMKQFKQLSQEYSSLKTIHYKYLGDVQNELRDICSSMVNVKDRYSDLSQQVRDAQNFSRSLLSIENSQTEVIVNEMKSLIEERSRSIAELQMITDQSHSLEVKLEEEKSRSIMFEERASKFEQQLQDLQQRAKFTEREQSLKHAQQVDKLNNDIENQKNYVKRLEDDIANLRKGQQVIQKSKSDVEESERKTQKENRVLTESIRKLQRQLEETKRYLSIVQTDRNNVHNEKENLRKELHEVLNSQRNSNLQPNSNSSLLSVPNISLSIPYNDRSSISSFQPRDFQPQQQQHSLGINSEDNSMMNPIIVTTPSGGEEKPRGVTIGPTITFTNPNTLGINNGSGLLNSQPVNQTPRTRSKSQFMRLQPASPKQTLAEIIPRTSIAKIDAPNNEAIILDSPQQNDEDYDEDEDDLSTREKHLLQQHLQQHGGDDDDEMVNHLPSDAMNELSTSFDYVVEESDDEQRIIHNHHNHHHVHDDDDSNPTTNNNQPEEEERQKSFTYNNHQFEGDYMSSDDDDDYEDSDQQDEIPSPNNSSPSNLY